MNKFNVELLKNSISGLFMSILLVSCTIENGPFCPSLTSALNNIIENNPNYKVVQIQASKLDGHNLLFITSMNSYNPDMIDGYYLYKNKLIIYYQTDSIDRSSIVNTKHLQEFNGAIDNFENCFHSNITTEPHCEYFEINKRGNILQFNPAVQLQRKHLTENNVIDNTELNRLLNLYIYNNIAVLYELRFIKKQNRQFVTLRSMISYDKDKYDGYFFRNGCLIVLYGTKNASTLLDYTWIKKNAYGIPNFRHQIIKDWNYSYPLKFEILSNGHIKELSFNDGFSI